MADFESDNLILAEVEDDYDLLDFDWTAYASTLSAAPSLVASINECGNDRHPIAEWSPWSTIFWDYTQRPFASYFEPHGYAQLALKNRPRAQTYQRLVPKTYAVAEAIFNGIPQKYIWGKSDRYKNTWVTLTSGKWRRHGRRSYPDPPMKLIDVLKSLCRDNTFAVANKDIDDYGHNVRHIRIDVDFEPIFNDLDSRQSHLEYILASSRNVFREVGLEIYIMRTGNKGIQIICPIAPLDYEDAKAVTWVLKSRLMDALETLADVAVDCTNVGGGLMRLPLGRHVATHNLALFVDEQGQILPPDQQAGCCIKAMTGRQVVDLILFESEADEPHAASASPIQADYYIRHGLRRILGVGYPWPQKTSKQPRRRLTKSNGGMKAHAKSILDAGFQQGHSYRYHMKRPKGEAPDGEEYLNAIGMALYVHDGDPQKAEEFLVDQARKVQGDVDSRIKRIRRYLRENNTVEYLATRSTGTARQYRDIEANITDDIQARAGNLVEALIEARRCSNHRCKKFPQKALNTIRTILEVVLADGKNVSQRSLAAECGVAVGDIQRQLAWITIGSSKCLLPILNVVHGFGNTATYEVIG